MCAVIGAVLLKPTEQDFNMIRRVFIQSKIRGLHATGLSTIPWWTKEIQTFKEPVSADKFTHLDNLEDMIADDGNLYLIGHCRYSTSDLQYNQPLYKRDKSIVHNGVITQELPENWKSLYGHECETKNDSELVLHSENPLQEFSHMSMGVCELTLDHKVRFYRNGKRPLYLTLLQNGCIITSTADIAIRANVPGTPTAIEASTYYTVDSTGSITKEYVTTEEKDYQFYEV